MRSTHASSLASVTAGPSGLPHAQRRLVLAGMVSAAVASLIPWALAQPVVDVQQGAFVAVSSLLVGRRTLDSALGQRLFDALKADDVGFAASTKALLDLINAQHIDPLQLQQTLDSQYPALAAVPRKIVTAWFLGVVGSGDKARCLAYEDALNAVVVADVLKPPTYAYGPYGSWTEKPE